MQINRRQFLLSSISLSLVIAFPKLAYAACDREGVMNELGIEDVAALIAISSGVVMMKQGVHPYVIVAGALVFVGGAAYLGYSHANFAKQCGTEIKNTIKENFSMDNVKENLNNLRMP
ncbi:hypothetical protein WAA39_002331 [Enterobacter mori]|uniref:hypothetical protein n=1 Tax=Enterobacter mori TaxID=539813 RepID=UPI0025C85105|nr:hypothetical protein [Enterobacter mori]EME8859693.1 hypothetical protein [Enterobacter mori]